MPDEAITDEDEDILNYDDLDDPDAFVIELWDILSRSNRLPPARAAFFMAGYIPENRRLTT